MIAVSTGTNNVFPSSHDGTTAGVAAALVATGVVDLHDVSHRAKRVMLHIVDPTRNAVIDETALVEAALVSTAFVGARAVKDPATIRWVVAAIAEPASTGVASIAGRVHPVDRREPGGVLVRLGPGGRRVRVPLAPGSFATVEVASVEPLESSQPVVLPGGGILAFDGERTTPTSAEATVTVSVEPSGPHVIDVAAAMVIGARQQIFDEHCRHVGAPLRKDSHGD